jgi:hypothetical protein
MSHKYHLLSFMFDPANCVDHTHILAHLEGSLRESQFKILQTLFTKSVI